jgi:AcrR family transcriptional regulator
MELQAASRRPYRQVERARRSQRTREGLLDVADGEFLAGRWEQASLEAMAARAGVTKQTLLRHFGSKEALLAQAMLRGYERVRAERFAAPTADIAGAVENLLEHYERWGAQALRIDASDAVVPAIAEIGALARQLHYDWVEHAFGRWLASRRGTARSRRRAALVALCDVRTWWLLSHDLALSRAEVGATLIQTISRILQEDT